jgi:hypothetical protein
VRLVFWADDELGDEVVSLYEWLRRSDQLSRSPVDMVARPGVPGQMGGTADLVVTVASAETNAVASVVRTWLNVRGVDVRIEHTPDGGKAQIVRAPSRKVDEVGAQLAEILDKEHRTDSVADGPTS